MALWLGSLNLIQAQVFEEDMATMQVAYENVDDLYLEMENTIWEDEKIVKQQNVAIYRRGGSYLYQMEDAAMLINNNYILMIDHLGKTIIYDNWTAGKAAALEKQHIPMAKDIEKKYPSISYLGVVDKHKRYILENEAIQLSKVEISFESKTGFMRKIRYYYNPKLVDKEVYTEMVLKVINTAPSFNMTTFSEKQFIKKTGNQFKGVGKYSSYLIHSAQ